MKVLFYSIQDFEKDYIIAANNNKHDIHFTEKSLNKNTVQLAVGFDAIALFTIDDSSSIVLDQLHLIGVKYITLRSVGFDHVDLKKAKELKIKVANVPDYSPNAIAEHTLALILALNRKLIIADRQVHNHNFKVDNLIGFDLNKKTAGIIGVGKIGAVTAKILHGFGSTILAYDLIEKEYLKKYYGVEYVNLNDLCAKSDIIILNCALNEKTHFIINKNNIALMKTGVMLINTARGAVINTIDVIQGLNSGKIGALGIDVYEKEKGLFYKDYRNIPLIDNMLEQLLKFDNVIITGHQAFLTKEALDAIESTTIHNLDCWETKQVLNNELV